MPVRSYSGIDLINYVEGFLIPSAHAALGGTSQGVFTVTGTQSTSDSLPPGSGGITDAEIGDTCAYRATGDMDFTAFPSIPEDALISSIDYQISGSVSGNVQANIGSGGPPGNSTSIISASVALEINGFNPVGDSGDDAGTSNIVVNLADSDNFSIHNLVEFDPPITRAELIASHAGVVLTGSYGLLSARARAGEVGSGADSDVSESLTFSFNNFLISVTYDSGPSIILNPSGGDVEPGQIITVTGDNVLGFTYAAVNGDQVIPIIPQIIGPNEITLEVPTPIAACDDCFDDCPECDECFDACNEDLDGEECQACMDACLDCLVDCMDDLEAGEDCQQAVNDPGDPTPITIICGTPGNEFTGSVPLGNFNILVARASGIYQLIDGKPEDTLYATARDGTTYDVKIPNPNGKSGFFRS